MGSIVQLERCLNDVNFGSALFTLSKVQYGAQLSDPEQLLEGTGNNLRHIKIKTVDDVDRPAIRQMIEQSLAERQQTLN